MKTLKLITNITLGVVLILDLCCINGGNDIVLNIVLFIICILIAFYLLTRENVIYVNGVKIVRIR